MAARKMEITVAVGLAVIMLALQAVAQSNGCSSVMMTLSPCLNFISSKSPAPGFSCCHTLASVVQSDPRCLCMVLDGSAVSFGISINHTRALELPGACKVQAPPISQCTGVPAPPATTPSSEEPTESTEAADAPKGSAEANATSGSINSKNAASLMATMLIPTCALLYVF